MRTASRVSRRGVTAKVVAVVLIVILEFSAAIYLYMNPVSGESVNPFVLPTSSPTTTTSTSVSTVTTHTSADHITVKSAVIRNDTLMMTVKNVGPSATQLLTVTSVCTPGFKVCYDYKKLAGAYYSTTFVLPAGRTFMANLTGVCMVPISSGPSPLKCKSYLPVANMSYYLQVKFNFADGASIQVPVSAKANGTWSPHITAITEIWPSLTIIPRNLTGMLNVTIGVNDSIPWGSFTVSLEGYAKPKNPFSATILSNETGCMNTAIDASNFTGDGHRGPLVNYTADCSEPFQVLTSFTTVMTAIAPGTTYLLVVRDTTDIDGPHGYPNYDGPSHTFVWTSNFALWIQGVVNSTA